MQKQNSLPEKISASISQLYKWAHHKFYFDELYLFITRKIVFNVVGSFSAWFDRTIVNGTVNTTAYLTEIFSDTLKPVQSGKVQQYALFFMFGILGLIIYLFFFNF